MKLTIISINYNNAAGLRKTMESVLNQTSKDLEYIIVDGGSTDGSKEVILHCANMPICQLKEGIKLTWISEKDSGIYNAMNQGIRMAKGDYIQFLNSGDLLAADDVTEKMLGELDDLSTESEVQILYGNMLKPYKGRIICDKGFAGRQPTMLDFYSGTLNHSPAYIKRTLFDKYGLYDENLKIVSDWKWYLQVIALGGVKPVYKDIDVTIFDMTGISTLNTLLDKSERRMVLEEILPICVIKDYDRYSFPFEQINRINRYIIVGYIFRITERMIFKIEKWFKLLEK